MKKINVALLGFGTVGRGTYEVIKNSKLVKVSKILEINENSIIASGLPKKMFTADINDILHDESIDIVAEMMGGIEPASSFMLEALKAGKNVVSSNKAALATNLKKLKNQAKKSNVKLLYEAAVCGAIPVLSAITGNLAGNTFNEIKGIVNGTSNYILTAMSENNMSYEDALKKAQALGFAEADPTADVEGIDAANKICLLADLAMGYYKKPGEIERTGISGITPLDIAKAKESGGKIKLVAKAVRNGDEVILSVKPELITPDNILYNVDYEFNGITLSCSAADDIFLYGRGAGSIPTGSAVAGDIISIAKCLC